MSRLCGYEPFFDESGEVAVCRKVVQGDYNFRSTWWDHVSDSAKDFICSVCFMSKLMRAPAKGLKYSNSIAYRFPTEHVLVWTKRKRLYSCLSSSLPFLVYKRSIYCFVYFRYFLWIRAIGRLLSKL